MTRPLLIAFAAFCLITSYAPELRSDSGSPGPDFQEFDSDPLKKPVAPSADVPAEPSEVSSIRVTAPTASTPISREINAAAPTPSTAWIRGFSLRTLVAWLTPTRADLDKAAQLMAAPPEPPGPMQRARW
jgi:hypothetical protein